MSHFLQPTKPMNPSSTAPKEGPFLGDFGYPWFLMTMWNEVNQDWAVATVQVGMYQGEWNDTYFETDNENKKNLLGWVPLPIKPIKP